MRPTTSSSVMAGVGVLLGALGLLLPHVIPGVPHGVTVILVLTALMLLLMAIAWWGRANDACDTARPGLHRRYTRELMVSMMVYVLVLFASLWLLKRVDTLPLRAMLALAPILPIGFAVRAMVRYVRDTDEMQRRIELEAISIATIFVSMLYMTGGFLQLAKVIDIPAGVVMIWMFPLVSFSYGIAKAVVSRRYS